MRPTSTTPDYWEANFGPFLDWMRPEGSDAIPGFMTQLTVTGPFINRTLFDQAGIDVPEGDTTWEEWADVTRRSPQPPARPSPWSWTAPATAWPARRSARARSFFDAEGFTRGRRRGHAPHDAAHDRLARRRHHDPDVWIGSAGAYVAGNLPFINAQVVLYMSGSWQVGQFAQT
jgi:alpha-1,4-digalacturonate transport system substrate-binding protein